eukprot:3233706-Amphidinium_carterae.2
MPNTQAYEQFTLKHSKFKGCVHLVLASYVSKAARSAAYTNPCMTVLKLVRCSGDLSLVFWRNTRRLGLVLVIIPLRVTLLRLPRIHHRCERGHVRRHPAKRGSAKKQEECRRTAHGNDNWASVAESQAWPTMGGASAQNRSIMTKTTASSRPHKSATGIEDYEQCCLSFFLARRRSQGRVRGTPMNY